MQRLMGMACCALLLTTAAAADDLTTVTTDSGRYLSVLGKAEGHTIIKDAPDETGIHDIASAGGNGDFGWSMADGNLTPANGLVTFGQAAGIHYQGYKFKRSATVTDLVWDNFTYGDGGTYDTAPAIEVYNRTTDTWTVVSATWDRPYDNSFSNGIQQYAITLDAPVVADGVRLIGQPAPGGPEFVSTSELVVNGSVNWGVDLATDLTELPGTTPIITHSQNTPGNPGINLIDNDLATFDTTVFAEDNGLGPEDYAGVLFQAAQDNVAGFGIVFKRFNDGGLLDTFAIETYDAASDTWTPVTGLSTSTYFDDFNYIVNTSPFGTELGYLFTFDEVDGVEGIRINGDGWGTAGDGFLGVTEIEVFAIPEPMTALLLAAGCLILRRR